MKRWLISLSLAAALGVAASAAFALPTVADVQAEVQKGNYSQAQTMMRDVVEAKPGSAKAHYIYAEILAHNARFADAAEQARVAKQLDPAIKFTTPDKFQAFQQLLDREQQRAQPRVATPTPSVTQSPNVSPLPRQSSPQVMPMQAPAERSSGIPVWVWVGLAAIAFIGWRMLRSRPAATMGAPSMGAPGGNSFGNYGSPAPYGPGPAYGPGGGMMQPGGGSGMMGVGLAAAGGVAAGMLAEKLLHGNHGSNMGNQSFDNGNFGGGGLGGNSLSAPERDDAARQLENRDVDFGSGNDWNDGSSSSDAGSFDTGSSGGGSDDW